MSKIWMTMLLLAVPVLYGAERPDPSLIPNMFTPESAPAHSNSQVAGFVLAITGTMFVLVAGLLVYVIIRYRRRANDDGMEPAQVYGSGPVEAAWTTVSQAGHRDRQRTPRASRSSECTGAYLPGPPRRFSFGVTKCLASGTSLSGRLG